MLLTGITFPILSKLILVKYGYKDYISIFGVTGSITNFITIPAGMMIVYATPLLSRYIDNPFKLRQMTGRVQLLVRRFNLYPATVLLLLLVIFSKELWQFDFFPTGIYLLVAGLSSCLFFSLRVPYVVIIRAFEKHVELSVITFWFQITSLGILFILAYLNYLDIYLYAFIMMLLAGINFILIKFQAQKSL